jgi:hypothetical protein
MAFVTRPRAIEEAGFSDPCVVPFGYVKKKSPELRL